jgi:hypothetical protein
MACFTDLPYANWSYQLLRTLYAAAGENAVKVSLGCYQAMPPANQMYQFYVNLHYIGGSIEPISENCFVQMTEDMQWYHLNEALEYSYNPVPPPEI